jgi:hypothetical protein
MDQPGALPLIYGPSSPGFVSNSGCAAAHVGNIIFSTSANLLATRVQNANGIIIREVRCSLERMGSR